MRAAAIVEVEITANGAPRLANAAISPQIDLLVFHAAPEPLDEDVVPPGPFPVHADGDAVPCEHAGEGLARELAALIGIEDVRLAVLGQGVLQRFDAKRRLHRDRYPPRQ